MKWFKHMSDAGQSQFLDGLFDEFGFAGPARWWWMLEAIASQMDRSDCCSVTYSWAKWSSILRGKQNNLRLFLEHCQNESKITFTEDGNKVRIECRNLLNLRDNYTKDLQVTANGTSKSSSKQEVEVEVEVEKRGDGGAPRTPPVQYQAIVNLFNEIMTNSPKVEVLSDPRKRRLATIWRSRKNFQDLNFWQAFFVHCSTVPWMRGESIDRSTNQPIPPASFDTLLRPANFARYVDDAVASWRLAQGQKK